MSEEHDCHPCVFFLAPSIQIFHLSLADAKPLINSNSNKMNPSLSGWLFVFFAPPHAEEQIVAFLTINILIIPLTLKKKSA